MVKRKASGDKRDKPVGAGYCPPHASGRNPKKGAARCAGNPSAGTGMKANDRERGKPVGDAKLVPREALYRAPGVSGHKPKNPAAPRAGNPSAGTGMKAGGRERGKPVGADYCPPHASGRNTKKGAARRAVTSATGTPAAGTRATDTLAASLCPIARQCGCCSCIDEPYAAQLARKQTGVEALFADLLAKSGMADGTASDSCEARPILGMERPERYRNKIASPFQPARRKGDPAILTGMYAAGTHKLVACDDCLVEHESGRRIIRAVRQLMTKWDIPPYDEDAGTGLIRNVVVRVGHESGEVLVTIVTNAREFPGGRNLARELVKRCPEITTVVQNVNTRQTNAILGTEERTLFGPGFILDTLCGLSFRISAHSFYQVNSVQTEILYREAVNLAGLGGGLGTVPFPPREGEQREAQEAFGSGGKGAVPNPPPASGGSEIQPGHPLVVLDAYCGTGTIGLVAASMAQNAQVIGVDNVESAIADARENARHNGIENAEFVCADAGAFMRKRAAAGQPVDVLLMDPPRAGASEEFLRATLELAPQEIVYISCNPATQARDCAVLVRGGYRLRTLQPVDMFPHTDHVENIALLVRS